MATLERLTNDPGARFRERLWRIRCFPKQRVSGPVNLRMITPYGCHLCGAQWSPRALRENAAAESQYTHECDADVVARFAFRALHHVVTTVTGYGLKWEMLHDRAFLAATLKRYRALSWGDRHASR